MELGEDEKRVRRTHYKELFGEKRQGKTRNACHSSLDMMRSQYRLEDGSAPGELLEALAGKLEGVAQLATLDCSETLPSGKT